MERKRSHSVSWPRRQRRHSPQGEWWWIATRSPGRDAVDARADLDHLARRLVAEHRGELAADVEVLDVGAAGRAGEHAADDLARPAHGIRRLFDDRLASARRCERPSSGTMVGVPAALSVSGLEKAYGSVRALVGVDLEVGEGELVGLLGPNGAGKSTLVKIACGLVRRPPGRAEVCGEPAGSREAHRSLGYLAELFRFPDWCTGRRAARAPPAPGRLRRRRRGAGGAARARRAHRRGRAPHRDDVQGHAAAARDRPGADRLAEAAAARRADERARPRRAAARCARCSRSCAAAGSRCC